MRRGAVQDFIDDLNKCLMDEAPITVRGPGTREVSYKVYRNGVDSGYEITIFFPLGRRLREYAIKLRNNECTLLLLRIATRSTTALGESGFTSCEARYFSWAVHRHQVPVEEARGVLITNKPQPT